MSLDLDAELDAVRLDGDQRAVIRRLLVVVWGWGYDAGHEAGTTLQAHALSVAQRDAQDAYAAGWAAREDAWQQEYARAVRVLLREYPTQAELARRRGEPEHLRRALAQEDRVWAGWPMGGAA